MGVGAPFVASERPARVIRRLVLHHTAGRDSASAEAIDRDHRENRGWAAIGYHVVIRRDGEVWLADEGRDLEHPGAHVAGHNADAVAVAVAGDYTAGPLPEAARALLLDVVVGLCSLLGLHEGQVVGHREIPGTATACPGYDPSELRAELALRRAAAPWPLTKEGAWTP